LPCLLKLNGVQDPFRYRLTDGDRDRGDRDPAVCNIRATALSRWGCQAMSDRIRIIKHEALPGCGSFEVRLPDRPSLFFYWDNIPARRLRRDMMDRDTALETAKAVARAARDSSGTTGR
jgi:hypothetical protein